MVLNLGCSKCFKTFPKIGDHTDYSGYNCQLWEQRSCQEHKRMALEVENAKTLTERKALEKEYGARYSKLHDLPYFDPITMHVIDPMHNLFLGTAKHVFIKWIEKGILTNSKLNLIDERMNCIKVPSKVGRIPGKF